MARLIARFRRDRRGSTALEFAFIAIPFLAVILAVFQTAMIYVSGLTLQSAVSDASRLIRTGKAKTMTQTEFRNQICSRVTATFDCASMLQVSVRSYTSFASAPAPSVPVVGGAIDPSFGTQYSPGGAGAIVVVQAAIAYPIVAPLLGSSLSNLNGDRILVMASAAFKNEGF